MTLLILGLIIWIAAHLFKRAAPDAHERMVTALGPGPSRGIMAGVILLAFLLIVIGYRGAPYVPVYDPPSWGIHLNNLLMFLAVGCFGVGHSKGRLKSVFRHPMLTGVLVWAFAHLLVNGDEASILLFGCMGFWALTSMVLINAREPAWAGPAPGPASADFRLLLITIVAFAAIATIHTLLGYWPFPQ